MTKKKLFISVGAVLAVLVALRLVAAFIWPTINDVTTGVTQEYPDLKPQRFEQSAERVFAAALATAKDMGFEVTAQAPERGEIGAVATTPVFRFKDDVTIRVVREGNASVVTVRSHSRIGKGDLGANARRIRDFQAALVKRL
jgi:uncharacterized protein (DUF1499 family)